MPCPPPRQFWKKYWERPGQLHALRGCGRQDEPRGVVDVDPRRDAPRCPAQVHTMHGVAHVQRRGIRIRTRIRSSEFDGGGGPFGNGAHRADELLV